MLHLTNYIKPGISATMLYPRAFVDENLHLEGIKAACALPDYEILDLCLPFDKHIREEEIKMGCLIPAAMSQRPAPAPFA